MREAVDRLAAVMARALLAWAGRRLAPSRRIWIEALRAELAAIDGGMRQLAWAMGGLRLVWLDWMDLTGRSRRFRFVVSHGCMPGLGLGLGLLIVSAATRNVPDDLFPWAPFYLLLFLYLALVGLRTGHHTRGVAAGAWAASSSAVLGLCFVLLAYGIKSPEDLPRGA